MQTHLKQPDARQFDAMIIQIEKALGENDCRHAIAVYNACYSIARAKDYTGHSVVHCFNDPLQSDDRYQMRKHVRNCLSIVTNALPSCGVIYPEAVVLAAIGPGGHHPRHADNCQQNERGTWLPNHTPQRAVSALYYLNGDFEGGEIVFEQHHLIVKPRTGLLIAFPSDQYHIHEVLPVRSGTRFSMPIWFTRQKSYAIRELIDPEGSFVPE